MAFVKTEVIGEMGESIQETGVRSQETGVRMKSRSLGRCAPRDDSDWYMECYMDGRSKTFNTPLVAAAAKPAGA